MIVVSQEKEILIGFLEPIMSGFVIWRGVELIKAIKEYFNDR